MNLRDFISDLENGGELVRISKEISTEYELANVLNALGERPTIFENVKGFDFPVFGGITSSRDIIARALGTTKEGLLAKTVEALRNPVPPKMVENAPCQEVVIKEPDLDKIPFLMHLPGDGGRYASATVAIIKDPETGRNACYHRLMQVGKNKCTARLIPKRQTRTTYDKTDGEVEMAVCIGSSVAVMIAASLGPPSGVDELAIANALDPTPLVKCVTKDLEVPADAEFVLEGRLVREVDREGPFVDLTETRDFERQEPVFIIDCITHRKDAMYQTLLPGRMEHKILMGMPKEPTIYDEVSKVVDCRNVLITIGGGSWLHGIVQIKKNNPDDGKKAIAAAFEGHKSMKHVIVLDEDVDIYDPVAVEWALATRFQAGKDTVTMLDQPGSSLDPSANHSGKKTLTDKVGLDATMPADVDPAKYVKVKYGEVNLNDYGR
ncbi:MAG: UbiD family decarboxylase [Candidatus Thermoplasmatota archaeon]|nr:UbiD family decarboxylase [Euryarchaeota archaeon]MBU4031508.1 UbiD family decarboxylase [Candidatus Thermoplasmatota archaeon]MBU4070871.1 UbiD family decarboxylase [Candidatus Thermoplasmatota archaeon]MBU4143571.1 UbiD family decarboxylase [Candidatus Thermoplasmatota archaeon]MBU4591758.1 UbiD family decarboxylase [Candidatus Thermoplasmatota archaeon]